MNKNWNDRADKDLFFTILSVKNIGVISGAEWTHIGNTMRSLGYGFTNEGCRQHFQGLRRAQHKAEANGSISEGPRKIDPTLNPITRRPGPGRGRPKKQPVPGTDTGAARPVLDPPLDANASVTDPALEAMGPTGDETDEPSPKRARLEEPSAGTTLDDEAVLALAAHTDAPTGVDAYPTDFSYSEA